MGFSSSLQGRAAHEALIMRQDAELRLMENMKRSIQMKAKCDKEYAISLAAVAQQGLKIDRADEMQGSLITKSWRSYMDGVDQQAKQFKANAELLEVVCEKLAHLSQDKRKARKTYQEEHAKIAARLNHLSDEVVRKKTEYQKHLEGYKALRTRFEEHYIKSGRGGRKLDDVRDKYQKACRKLHLTHNEYVLSISEAVEVEKDFRTVLLPGLLEHQQSVQESFILLWKNILQEASQHGDLTSEKFNEIQKRIDNVIYNINPGEEYREFTDKHRTSPTTPHVFQFDESLIEDIPGKLQSSTLTVDNLTVDWLRSRLLDLEQAVKECQEKQLKMIEPVNGGSPIANGGIMTNGGATTNGIQSNKDCQSRQSKDLNALRCQEKQKQKLVDMIKCALNEVGCEELPSGCDDHLTMDQTFIENSFANENQTSNASTSSASVSIMNELMRRGGVLTLLRGRHFKRKSTPQPTTPTARTRTQRFAHVQPRSQSLGSLSVNSSPAKYEPITNPLRMAASVEATGGRGLHAIDFEPVIMFERNATTANAPLTATATAEAEAPPLLPQWHKRTRLSMLCVSEEAAADSATPSSAESDCLAPRFRLLSNTPDAHHPATSSACVHTNLQNTSNKNNNNNNNNSNIYTDLELVVGEGGVDSERVGAVESNEEEEAEVSGDGEQQTEQLRETLKLDDDQVTEHTEKTDFHIDTAGEASSFSESSKRQEEGTEGACVPPAVAVSAGEPTKSSIDAHLDKIDQLNRALDDRLKRQLPPVPAQHSQDVNAIETAEPAVLTRSKYNDDASDAKSCSCSKRTSSSSSEGHARAAQAQAQPNEDPNSKNNKKRSLSFSQKSINAILTNIKEFSKSPLSRIHKAAHNSPVAEECEMIHDDANEPNNPAGENRGGDEANATDCGANNNDKSPSTTNIREKDTRTASVANPSKDADQITHASKLKLKVPKIQKKSKAIRNTFRSKLMNFQLKHVGGGGSGGGKLCKTCTKRHRIHPSKGVFDFAKEFNTATDGGGGDDFCSCAVNHQAKLITTAGGEQRFESTSSADAEDEEESSDDVLSMKDHCYSVPSLSTSMSLSTNRPLYEEEWFHGVLPREEVVRLLNNDGDFLVRETIRNEESQIVLSVCWNGHKHFIVQTTVDGHFRFEGPPFPSIQELIMHQYQSELPVTVKSGSILRRPVCRERWELSNDDVVLLEKIGRGNFGDVYKAKLKSTKLDVAVKTCRMTLPDEQKRKFLQEGRILKQYDHPNIVKLIGICVQKQPIMIVMELVPGGSLLNYLRKNSNTLSTRQQMGMCRDAAAGMRYLEMKNCIHRDLAARNCLVDFENSVKISDFGMSREEEEYIVSDGMKQIPVKWTAPEALNFGKYTSLCDVWSYGILMWEIFSKGDTPYSGMSNSRARERIDTGYRMPAPESTPPEMYRLMLKCWAAEAETRPHFDEIFNVVDALIHRLDNSH